MSAAITVQFPGELESFVQQRVGTSGLYDSASEYIRDLVRRDYEQEDRRRWAILENELAPGMKADESEFVPLEAASVIAEATARQHAWSR
jgi:antitoxin ParD1/3/4